MRRAIKVGSGWLLGLQYGRKNLCRHTSEQFTHAVAIVDIGADYGSCLLLLQGTNDIDVHQWTCE